MQRLKQSTAFTTIVGPILDSAGAEYTGAVIGDLDITKNGTTAAMAAAATLTHISNGRYTLVGTTGNSDTIGRLDITCNKSTYQMPPVRFEVLHANVYDVLFGSTAPSTLGGTAQTGDAYAIVNNGTYGNAQLLRTSAYTTPPTVVQVRQEMDSNSTKLANLDATMSSRLAASSYTAPPSAATISTQVTSDLLAAHGSGSWQTATGFAVPGSAMTLTSGERTAIANEVETQIIDDTDTEKVLLAITNKIAEANPDLSGLTLSAIASAVRTALTTELARIDVAISTRLASGSYTAPDNSGISNAASAAASAKTAAESVDAKLTAPRLALIDGSAQETAATSNRNTVTSAVFTAVSASTTTIIAAIDALDFTPAPTAEENAAAVDTLLSANHGNTAWGAATIYVTPVTSTVSAGEVSSWTTVVGYQYAPLVFTISIVDDNGEPINLTGKVLRLICEHLEDSAASFELASVDDEINVSGEGGNDVAIEAGSSFMITAGTYRCNLRSDTDDGKVFAIGMINIVELIAEVPEVK